MHALHSQRIRNTHTQFMEALIYYTHHSRAGGNPVQVQCSVINMSAPKLGNSY